MMEKRLVFTIHDTSFTADELHLLHKAAIASRAVTTTRLVSLAARKNIRDEGYPISSQEGHQNRVRVYRWLASHHGHVKSTQPKIHLSLMDKLGRIEGLMEMDKGRRMRGVK